MTCWNFSQTKEEETHLGVNREFANYEVLNKIPLTFGSAVRRSLFWQHWCMDLAKFDCIYYFRELALVLHVGCSTMYRQNFVFWHVGHLLPGIKLTDDGKFMKQILSAFIRTEYDCIISCSIRFCSMFWHWHLDISFWIRLILWKMFWISSHIAGLLSTIAKFLVRLYSYRTITIHCNQSKQKNDHLDRPYHYIKDEHLNQIKCIRRDRLVQNFWVQETILNDNLNLLQKLLVVLML